MYGSSFTGSTGASVVTGTAAVVSGGGGASSVVDAGAAVVVAGGGVVVEDGAVSDRLVWSPLPHPVNIRAPANTQTARFRVIEVPSDGDGIPCVVQTRLPLGFRRSHPIAPNTSAGTNSPVRAQNSATIAHTLVRSAASIPRSVSSNATTGIFLSIIGAEGAAGSGH